MSEAADRALVESVRAKSRHLESLLNDFSGRLRRMRERNRQLEQEIGEFEADLARMKEWLEGLNDQG